MPKQPAKNTKNITSFPCFVRPEKFHPYLGTYNRLCEAFHVNDIDDESDVDYAE